jgi:hypothetical protein
MICDRPSFHCSVTITSFDGRASFEPLSLVPGSRSVLDYALQRLVDGEDTMDTKFVLFSKRRVQTVVPGGQVPTVGAEVPRVVYASASMLSSISEYFQNCKFGFLIL